MKLETMTPGKRVKYASKAHEGRGEITKVEKKKTGHWVSIFDKTRNTVITVRPSQIG